MHSLKHAVRALAKSPALVLVAVITLALGVGATTAIFSVVDAVVLRPLPFPDGDRLAFLGSKRVTSKKMANSWSWPNFKDVKEQSKSIPELSAFYGGTFTMTGRGDARRLDGTVSTADLFRVLRTPPMLGRDFAAGEDEPGKNNVVILGHAFWQSEFHGDRNVLGQTVTLNGTPRTVVGIMPPGFRFPLQNADPSVYVPAPQGPMDVDARSQRGAQYMLLVGRLAPGATFIEAGAELEAIRQRLAIEYPDNLRNRIFSAGSLHDWIVRDVRLGLLLVLGLVMIVLLIACTNVANLLLARASVRHREIAIRLALGASRGRILWDVMVESMLLSIAGCAAGVLLAMWGVDWLRALVPVEIGAVRPILVDARVLAFSVGASLLTGLIFGLIPARQALKAQAGEALQATMARAGSRKTRLRSALVAGEIAASMLLLVCAGLLLRSFWKLQAVDPGFDPTNITVGEIDLPDGKYPDSPQYIQFYQRLLRELPALPGAKAAVIYPVPYSGGNIGFVTEVVGGPPPAPGERKGTGFRAASPGVFETLRIPIVAGRAFTADEDSPTGPPVVVVGQNYVKRFLPDDNPIGKKIIIGYGDPVPREIVGVAGDVKDAGLAEEVGAMVYAPFSQTPWPALAVVVRSTAPVAGALRSTAHAVDADVPVDLKTLDDYMRQSVAQRRLTAQLLLLFAAVALLMALVGVYGVVSYGVTQRVHELSVRAALGAKPVQLVRLILHHGLLLAGIGVGVGAIGSVIVTRFFAGLLYGVSTEDPITFAAVGAILLGVTAIASFIPARRAARFDPMTVLRKE